MNAIAEPRLAEPGLAARRRYIGGSDISAILGISPWKTATDLWLDKTAEPDDGEQRDTPATRRGSRLEPYIVDMIRSEFDLQIVARGVRYVDAEVPYFAAEIDAETTDENIEIKTVHPFLAKEWGTGETDELPLHYVAQVQWGLGVRGRSRCHVFALIGDDLRHYQVEADAETLAAMRARAADFWQRYVVPRIAPPLDYDDPRTLDTLKRLYPGTDGSSLDAGDELQRWRAVMEQAAERAKQYEAVVDGAKAHLLHAMGAAALLRFPDGRALRRKEVTRKGYVVEPATYMDTRFVNVKGE